MKRLKDSIGPGLRVLFVGINPGMRSAAIGHHFAGYSNRFWKLLFDSGLLPERLRAEDDRRLPEWGLGITNLIPRCTPGIDTLAPEEYRKGVAALRRKVRRLKPAFVVFVGVTGFRAVSTQKAPVALGLQSALFEGARVFVVPNPSGRNANYSYDEMLAAFRGVKEASRDKALLRRRPRVASSA
jgi:TDG/mug DNA glycosylase family protein